MTLSKYDSSFFVISCLLINCLKFDFAWFYGYHSFRNYIKFDIFVDIFLLHMFVQYYDLILLQIRQMTVSNQFLCMFTLLSIVLLVFVSFQVMARLLFDTFLYWWLQRCCSCLSILSPHHWTLQPDVVKILSEP